MKNITFTAGKPFDWEELNGKVIQVIVTKTMDKNDKVKTIVLGVCGYDLYLLHQDIIQEQHS